MAPSREESRVVSALLQAVASSPVPLPPGREIPPVDGASAPTLWCSDATPTAELIRQLRTAHPVSGLWPLLVHDDGLELFPELASTPDAHDAALVLAGFWYRYTRNSPSGTTSPYGQRWPRTAPAGERREDPHDCADALTRELLRGNPRIPRRLGLVPAASGADALTVMGWAGPLNYDNDTAKFSAVLRSWQDRYGITIVEIDTSRLTVSVAAPPANLGAALQLAAEHFAFCPDTLWQGHPHTIREYAPRLLDARSWSFWWD